MSLKLRFSLLLTTIVTVVLLLSSFAIYYLYQQHRIEDFKEKLSLNASFFYDEYLEHKNEVVEFENLIKTFFSENTTSKKEIIIVSNKDSILFSTISQPNKSDVEVAIKKLHKTTEISFSKNKYQCYGFVNKDTKAKIIIFAIDKTRIENLGNLQTILIIVLVFSTLLTAIVSYLLVYNGLEPLTKLNFQIQKITELNLNTKIEATNSSNEINQIAVNFNSLLDRLHLAFATQKNFIHHASHELRTPLTSMFATTELALHKELSSEEYKQILRSLKEEQNKLIELTNSLLLLSQFDKLQFANNLKTIRIDEVLLDTISYGNKVYLGLQIEFLFGNIPEDDTFLLLQANDVLLQSAFTNLLKNAFLYSSNKFVTISLEASKKSIKISFSNKGKTLSNVEIENIFAPFSRGENIGLAKGTGFGLNIVNKIVTNFNGTFTYSKPWEEQNCFTIEFFHS
jgi:signal transduction histidine kinase